MVLRVLGQAGLAFVLVYVVARVLGKREVSQGTFWSFVSAIALGSLGAQLATTGLEGVAAMAGVIVAWGIYSYTVSHVVMANRRVRAVLDSKPTIIVHNGKILEDQMRKIRYNLDSLMSDLRLKNVTSLSDVEFAILETSGQLSVILKSQKQPVTPSDLKLPTSYIGQSVELVVDGNVIHQNLQQVGLTREWLDTELRLRGVSEMQHVVLATLDTQGRLYVDLRSDQLEHLQRPGDLMH